MPRSKIHGPGYDPDHGQKGHGAEYTFAGALRCLLLAATARFQPISIRCVHPHFCYPVVLWSRVSAPLFPVCPPSPLPLPLPLPACALTCTSSPDAMLPPAKPVDPTHLRSRRPGFRHVFDESSCPITVISFAKLRNDLLAFANAEGQVWFVDFSEPRARVSQAPRMHKRGVTALDWSFDNSHLITCGADGSMCVWRVRDATCARVISTGGPAHCCRFHPVNSNMAFVGSDHGRVTVYNVSTGVALRRTQLPTEAPRGSGSGGGAGAPGAPPPLQVTALECTTQHVFVGDSYGWLHRYKSEMKAGQLQPLDWAQKVRVGGGGDSKATGGSGGSSGVVTVQYMSFCVATSSPALLTTAQDASVLLLKLGDQGHMEVAVRYPLPPTKTHIKAVLAPLSCMNDYPYITMGGDDTNVNIYRLDKGSKHCAAVASLQGHSDTVVDVSWSYDESLLATVDADGMAIVWRRGHE